MHGMKLILNDDINAYLRRCRTNLSDERLNRFLDRKVTPGNESAVQKALKKAGSPEFQGSPDTWPSLFLSVEDWMESPYHKAITAKLSEHGSYSREVFLGRRLFNADAVQPDPAKELGDWMKLRALDQNAETLVLTDGEIEWMLDAPSEAATNDPYARKAHGNVITFGLGIGYFLFMALLNPAVNHVTVIEQNEAIIETFRSVFLPLFPSPEKITIRCADAYDVWQAESLSDFDYIYADIWQSGDDGLFAMQRLLRQYQPPLENADFWIEDSCVVPLRTLIYLHYEELAHGKKQPVSPDYEPLMDQVRAWFAQEEITVDSPEPLKQYMYDRAVLRKILGGRAHAR